MSAALEPEILWARYGSYADRKARPDDGPNHPGPEIPLTFAGWLDEERRHMGDQLTLADDEPAGSLADP